MDQSSSLLVFSGLLLFRSDVLEDWLRNNSGATKQDRTPLSEGESYLVVLSELKFTAS